MKVDKILVFSTQKLLNIAQYSEVIDRSFLFQGRVVRKPINRINGGFHLAL